MFLISGQMAENKKSFIAYADWEGMFEALPDEIAGRLIKHVFAYVNDKNPTSEDFIIKALFEQIKATLKRDLQKWEKQKEQRSEAGKRSAEVRATKSNERSISFNETQRNPTVSVSVSDSVNNKNTIVESIDFDVLLSYINKAFNRSFQTINKATRQKYLARLKESYSKEHIKNAIDNCVNDKYHKETNYKFCTPEYFSRSNTLELHSHVAKVEEKVYKTSDDILYENVMAEVKRLESL